MILFLSCLVCTAISQGNLDQGDFLPPNEARVDLVRNTYSKFPVDILGIKEPITLTYASEYFDGGTIGVRVTDVNGKVFAFGMSPHNSPMQLKKKGERLEPLGAHKFLNANIVIDGIFPSDENSRKIWRQGPEESAIYGMMLRWYKLNKKHKDAFHIKRLLIGFDYRFGSTLPFGKEGNGNVSQKVSPVRKIAMLVGVSDYADPALPDLQFCENDVTVIGSELERLGFETTVITAQNARQEKLQKKLNSFVKKAKQLNESDIVLMMFSGHGLELKCTRKKRTLGEGKTKLTTQLDSFPFFCPQDAIPFDPLRISVSQKAEAEVADQFQLISVGDLMHQLAEKCKSRKKLFVVDASYHNPNRSGFGKITSKSVRDIPDGFSILFPAKPDQNSHESTEDAIHHGVMSHFLIEGLRGKAKDDRDEITWVDLVSHVQKSTIRSKGNLAGSSECMQNPHLVGYPAEIVGLGKFKMHPLRSPHCGMEFVKVKAGKFLMGSSDDKKDPDLAEGEIDGETLHQVEFTEDFYLGKFEVTQEEWNSVMKTSPWLKDGVPKEDVRVGNRFPASYVTWEDAKIFCKKLSEKDGRIYRLPTEAQWEYACRGGTNTNYSFGDDKKDLSDFGWWGGLFDDQGNCKDEPYAHKVGLKKPNPLGLFDIHGNVWEWCEDNYDLEFYKKSRTRDPVNFNGTTIRVLRGGCWFSSQSFCRSAMRDGLGMSSDSGIGFRVMYRKSD